VIAFRPISMAVRSWSYDKFECSTSKQNPDESYIYVLFNKNYRKLSTTKVNINNVEFYFVYIVGSANFGNNRATLSKYVARCNMSRVARSHAQQCHVRLWVTNVTWPRFDQSA